MRNHSRAWMSYPLHIGIRTGMKVSWLTYKTQADAEKASKAAKNNAVLQAAKGYDFGYRTPGEIEKTKDGLYEVTIP